MCERFRSNPVGCVMAAAQLIGSQSRLPGLQLLPLPSRGLDPFAGLVTSDRTDGITHVYVMHPNSLADAHAIEQSVLAELCRMGVTIGGEFAKLPANAACWIIEREVWRISEANHLSSMPAGVTGALGSESQGGCLDRS